MGACVLGFAAGALSAFSPCVLPLLPLVLAGAVERHRLGPLVLAAGLAASATVVGFAVALLGFGLDRDLVRVLAGGLLVLVGLVLLIARLDVAVARAAAPIAAGAAALLARLGKPAVGVALVLLGMLSVTGGDKVLETRVLDAMPAWLVDLTTRF